jgi:hypothetical protein
MPICIAGMHRAGTSMVARVLEGCGADLGGPGHFAPPAPDNRDGYWEDLRFVALNERILDRFEGAWDHPPVLPAGWEASERLEVERREAETLLASRAEPWGFKDPRNSLTLPFWKRLVARMKVVVCLRNPLEVSASLRARGYTSERFGLTLWEAYYRALEVAVDESSALVTHYESFLADPRAELERVLGFVGLQASAALREAVLGAASPDARHQRRTSAEVEASALSAAGKRLYASLCARSGPVYEEARRREQATTAPPPRQEAGPRGLPEQIAELEARLEARELELASIKPVVVARTEEVDSVKRVLAARDAQLASVLPVLAAREAEIGSAKEELASVKAVLAARDKELAAIRAVLADRERLFGSLKGVLIALKRLVSAAR